MTELGERLGEHRLAGLVNNAGIAVGGPHEFLELEQWRQQFEVNVFGLVDLTQRLIPRLLRARGRVVNISSIGGRVSTPMLGPYSASKFAVEAITAALRMELAPMGVWAATVEPGMVKTEIWKKADEQLERYDRKLPAEAKERYAPLIRSLTNFNTAGSTRGVDPRRVARAIEHALFARRPRMRYLVGTDARLLIAVRWLLPDRAFEWLLRRAM